MRNVFKLCCVWLLTTTFTVVHSVDTTTHTACGHEQLVQDLRHVLMQTQSSAQNCKSDHGMGAVVAQLVAELSSLKDNLNVLKISQQTVTSQLQATKSEQEAMRSELQDTKSELQDTKSELRATKSELQDTKSELEATKSELQDTKSKLQNTKSELQDTKSELQDTKSELESMKINLETEFQSTKVERQTMQSQGYRPFDTQLQSLQEELERMKSELELARTALNTSTPDQSASQLQTTGSAFVRWGRKSCPDNTTLVYSGVAGGKSHAHKGDGTNALCLTRTPQSDNTVAPKYTGFLYGAEYQHIPGHHNHDVPCSVCLAPQSSTIMVPATLTCPPGWTPQYSGHLAAQWKDDHANEYVCLDGSPEDASSGMRNDNGLLLHYVVTVCGSLPCPPYVGGKVVTCVVCSK